MRVDVINVIFIQRVQLFTDVGRFYAPATNNMRREALFIRLSIHLLLHHTVATDKT